MNTENKHIEKLEKTWEAPRLISEEMSKTEDIGKNPSSHESTSGIS